MSPHPAITITDKNSSPVKYFIVLSLHPRVEKHPITEIQARMRITRQDAKLSSLHPEHLPVRPADPHPVLRPSRRRLQSTVVVRFGRWAPHLLKTIIRRCRTQSRSSSSVQHHITSIKRVAARRYSPLTSSASALLSFTMLRSPQSGMLSSNGGVWS